MLGLGQILGAVPWLQAWVGILVGSGRRSGCCRGSGIGRGLVWLLAHGQLPAAWLLQCLRQPVADSNIINNI